MQIGSGYDHVMQKTGKFEWVHWFCHHIWAWYVPTETRERLGVYDGRLWRIRTDRPSDKAERSWIWEGVIQGRVLCHTNPTMCMVKVKLKMAVQVYHNLRLGPHRVRRTWLRGHLHTSAFFYCEILTLDYETSNACRQCVRSLHRSQYVLSISHLNPPHTGPSHYS